MAGIGFDLRRLLQEDRGLVARLRAYSAAGLIAAGPWLVTMASLLLVRTAAVWLDQREFERFLAVVGGVFAASLVTVSGLQMAVSRYLADELYLQRYGGLLPAFATCTALVAAVQAVTGWFLCWWFGLEPSLTVAVVFLYVAVSLSWLGMSWLTVIRQHDRVLIVHLIGAAAFLLALQLAGPESGLADVVMAYALCNGLIVVLTGVLVATGVESTGARSKAVVPGVWRHRVLFLAGTAYGLSLWIDKWVFWACDGTATLGTLHQHPLYDGCFYLGYLTVIPALSINLVHLETEFYARYRAYFGAVTGNRSLRDIRWFGEDMARSLRTSAGKLLRIQGAVTVACIALAGPIVEFAGLPPYAVRVFRFVCLGAFCHVLLLITVLVLLYFDRRHAALRSCLLFLGLNALLAWWSVGAGPWTYGAGFAVAALLGLVAALVELRRTLGRLEYLTFMQA